MNKKNFKTGFDSLLGESSFEVKSKDNSAAETRATFIVKIDNLEKLKSICYWERKLLKNVIDEAVSTYIEQYETKNGSIKLPK